MLPIVLVLYVNNVHVVLNKKTEYQAKSHNYKLSKTDNKQHAHYLLTTLCKILN